MVENFFIPIKINQCLLEAIITRHYSIQWFCPISIFQFVASAYRVDYSFTLLYNA